MQDDPHGRHMGFTRAEWVTALSPRLGEAKARRYVNVLFRGPDPRDDWFDGPDQIHLNAETYALLAMVNADCRRRVAEQLATAPVELRVEAERMMRAYDRRAERSWRRFWPFRD